MTRTEPLLALVDFGNTLVDETFLWTDSEAFPNWASQWSEVMDVFAPSWNQGTVSTDDLITEMAGRLTCVRGAAADYFYSLCRHVTAYPTINAAIAYRHARGARQAMVTVNPDALLRHIASDLDISHNFDLIVTSAEIGNDDKIEICLAACERLGVSPENSLLIDNIEGHVNRWRKAGGLGYVFSGDDRFAEDVQRDLIPGFLAADIVPWPT